MTLNDASIATMGVPGNSVLHPPLILSTNGNGLLEFNPKPSKETFNPRQILDKLNDETELHSSLYGETWSSRLSKALNDAETLKTVLGDATFTQIFDNQRMSAKLKTAARVSQRTRKKL